MEVNYLEKAKEINRKHENDEYILNLLDKFVDNYFANMSVGNQKWNIGCYGIVISRYKEILINNLNWNIFCNFYGQLQTHERPCCYKLFKFFLDNKFYNGEYKDFLINNSWVVDIERGLNSLKVFYPGSKPQYFHLVNLLDKSKGGYKTRFNLNTDNQFIKDILIRFINSLTDKEKQMTRIKDFIYHFNRSLYSLSYQVNCIEDFSYYTFSKQFRYYKNINWQEHKAVSILIRFYTFLLNYIEESGSNHRVFKNSDGIDKYFLYKRNFHNQYSEGFRVVYFNNFDPVPNGDRWMISPNGFENITISIKLHEYIPADFSKVRSIKYKHALKLWYWSASNENLNSKSKSFHIIVEFIQFIENLRNRLKKNRVININEQKNISKSMEYDISVYDIIQFKLHLKDYYDNNFSRNSCISAVKSFSSFSYYQGILNIQIGAFDYLTHFTKDEYTGGKPITERDLYKIIKVYKSLYDQGELINKLHWIIIYLCTMTNLRIGEVLKLKRNCIIEVMKKGQYAIKYIPDGSFSDEYKEVRPTMKLLRKGSSGKYKEENIDLFTYKIVKEAKKITLDLAEKSDKEIKDYIFLKVSTNKNIKTITKNSVYNRFKNITEKLDLEGGPYTIYNLRDTYMSGIYNEGLKRGLTIEEIHPATGHKDIKTTIKHYRCGNIKDYLETFYKVRIGNIRVNGKVAKSIQDVVDIIPENINQIIVGEKCGYCKNKGCIEDYEIECLICPSFVATLDRIPYFKERIERLNTMISNETIEHEKKHLVDIKKILVSFLERLYNLKKGINDNGA